jgi:hypothetical protein
MTAVGARAVATALVAATLASSCGDDGGLPGPLYESAQQLAETLGCGASFEVERPPEGDPNELVLVGSTVDGGTCVLGGSSVLLQVTDTAGADDALGAGFQALSCLGEPTDGSDHHYAEGRRWIAVPADPRNGAQAAALAELLGGRVASFGCAA